MTRRCPESTGEGLGERMDLDHKLSFLSVSERFEGSTGDGFMAESWLEEGTAIHSFREPLIGKSGGLVGSRCLISISVEGICNYRRSIKQAQPICAAGGRLEVWAATRMLLPDLVTGVTARERVC